MNLNFSAINESKNLLAFSGGIDSTALFFLLLEKNIPFDIAIVDYNLRAQSKEEIQYAKELAVKYNKKVFVKEIYLKSSNFEKQARDVRYAFFEEIIKEYKYINLITAHQLNDKLEWFLMQLSKGAGLVELIGFNTWENKENYFIYKPLLEISKDELEKYLKTNNIKYFIDQSNYDEKYKRNYFRHNFSDEFLNQFKDGVKNSFKYLDKDLKSLNITNNILYERNELKIIKASHDNNINIRVIDIELKKRGILVSNKTREEILKQKEIVISHKISIAIDTKYIWISPFVNNSMSKKFKESCRVKKIPKNIRAYLYEENINLKDLMV